MNRPFLRRAAGALPLVLAACAARPEIVDRPVPFGARRQELTRAYIERQYGLKVEDITIVPRMIVLHWTASDRFDVSYNTFIPDTAAGRPDLMKAGNLNVGIQFLVGMDGKTYRLMPETWMARHVIGLNYEAIGVENVGGGHGDNLTDAQIKANIELVRYLVKKYPTIEYLIGHHEYTRFEGTPLWRERDPTYRTSKVDPGERFMNAVRTAVADLKLKGPPQK
ncbi:MAG: N-acetylmuramoyl-L-alanine amidase [Gemmatimonadetes bacterium]|nr:N-acetylmuramoyl-L-alanine amidase [Gemmatimonadota bacterium]